MPPRLFASRNALPPEGVAAPVARQSRFHGPCWNGEALSYRQLLEENLRTCGSISACALMDSAKKVGLSPACGLQDRALQPRAPRAMGLL